MSPPKLPPDEKGFVPGHVIGPYKLVKRLGKGGFGEVWQAVDQRFQRLVAVKFLLAKHKDDKKVVKRFRSEAVLASRITHPSIVQMLDTGQSPEGDYFHVMEFVEGEILSERIKAADAANTTLGMPFAGYVAWQIAVVLAATHQRGVIHRDLKPMNLMLVPDGMVPGGQRVKLLDFGIAKLTDSEEAQRLDIDSETTTGAHIGSPIIMAKEQWKTGVELTTQVDVYALGCILYKMLAGTWPFEGSAVELRVHHELLDPTPLCKEEPSVPTDVGSLVDSMLAKDPSQRPTMAQVRDTLGRILGLQAAAAGQVVIRPTMEINALLGEISTGGVTANTVTGDDATADVDRAEKPASGVEGHTSAKNGQQIPVPTAMSNRRRVRRFVAAGAGVLVIAGLSILALSRGNYVGQQPSVPAAALVAEPQPRVTPSTHAAVPDMAVTTNAQPPLITEPDDKLKAERKKRSGKKKGLMVSD